MTLRDLYLAELSDLYEAERQLLLELPLLSAAATSVPLREAFDAHYRQTLQHLDRLGEIFLELDERPRSNGARGLPGIIADARARNAGAERGAVLDAALLAVAMQIEHYEVAAYEAAYASATGVTDLYGAEMLTRTLAEEIDMNRRLERLAGLTRPRTTLRAPIETNQPTEVMLARGNRQ